MHRSRVLLSKAAKNIIAAESSSTTTAAKDASSKATLPAANNTTTYNNNNNVVAASEPPHPRNGNPNSTLTDNSPFQNSTKTTTTATTTTTETSTSHHENPTTTITETKIPPYNIIALYHHAQPYTLFPPLLPGTLSYLTYHFSSTLSAIYNLCTSEESRDRFISLTNPSTTTTINHDHDDETEASVAGTGGQRANNPISIINTSVLGQSDVGLFKPLTLFQELSHPLFQLDESHSNYDNNDGNKNIDHSRKKINIKEFMMGCGWALEQFHRTNFEVLNKWFALHKMENKANNPKVEKKSEGVVNDNSSSSSSSSLFYQKKICAPSPHSSWLEFDFKKMTTPELIVTTEHILRLILLRGKNPTAGTLVDTRVTNVALLSARVKEIYPPSSSSSTSSSSKKKPNENSDSVDAPLEDDSLMSHQPAYERKVQVVAQLEVLYELQEVKDRTESNNKSTSTKHTKTQLVVGKFEACIEGDPNNHQQADGNDKDNDIGNLRWKLASYRPALEFEKTF